MNSAGFLGGGKEEPGGTWGLEKGRQEGRLMVPANALHVSVLI